MTLGDIASKPLLFLEKNFLNNCDAIIVYSEWIKKLVRQRIRKEKSIQVVCNPIDGSLFNPDVKPYSRVSLGFGSNDRLVLYVGKLTPLKGTEDLLAAARLLPEFKFLLVGRTVALPNGYYEKMAPRNVVFHEPIPHTLVPQFMKMCDCYVQPTLRDGLEIPIAEASAVGKPVVTTLHEERKEIYEKAAYYAKPKNPKSLASAIAEAWENGPKNADKVLTKFDIKKNTSLIEKMLLG
jgi:glycosyltransferase involved in cell wall biosynthesis